MSQKRKNHDCQFLEHDNQLKKYKLWLKHLEEVKFENISDSAIIEVVIDDVKILINYLQTASNKNRVFKFLDGKEDCIPFINKIFVKTNCKSYLKIKSIIESYTYFTGTYKKVFKQDYERILKENNLYCKHCVKNFF